MRKREYNTFLKALLFAVPVFLFLTGCAINTLSEKAVPLEESQFTEGNQETAISIYYNFKDVPIPEELEIRKDKSVIFQTAEFTAGLLSFVTKLNSDSLISFFNSKMPEDGWRFLSFFNSSIKILFFVKENRFCIITVTGETRVEEVEILVTPKFQYAK